LIPLRWLTLPVIILLACSGWPDGTTAGIKRHNCSSPTGIITPADRPVTNKAVDYYLNGKDNPSEFYDICLLVDTFNLSLTVFSKGEAVRKYPVAAGRPGSETPVGVWKIINKSDIPAPGTGARWMELNIPGGTYGIHGTDNPWSIGSYASGGCIRLQNAHVEEIYPWVSIGACVIIAGNPFGRFGEDYPLLSQGNCSSAVWEVQYTLKRLGFYQGEIDGIFGAGTAQAVSDFRRKKGLPEGFYVDEEVYHLLGL